MKIKCLAIVIVLMFGFIAFSPKVHAVSPPPDGGYAGGNTAEGQNALFSLTTGGFNTAVGFLSLRSNTAGSFNTAIGAGTLLANTADGNTATGVGALLSNTTGFANTANGAFALFSNTTGSNNTAIGHDTLMSNTSSNANTAIGGEALANNTSGSQNTANGQQALSGNTSGSLNIALGFRAGINVTTADNVICIGADGNNVANSCFIGRIFGSTSVNGVAVLVNSNGRLGTMTSSARFKDEIKPMDKASEALFGLKPVAFRYKKDIDPAGTPQLGLVAEDVEKVNPDLVVRDKDGKAYSVRYDQVNAMLLNEFLKEHKALLEQQRKVQTLEVALKSVNERLREQEAKIESVSAQIEMSNPAPQMAANER
jgi:hypothetical protein